MKKLPVVATFGRPRKHGYVRVFKVTAEGRDLVRVQWRELGAHTPSTESFPDSRKGIAEAKAFAEGTHDRLMTKAPLVSYEAMTLRGLWDRYVAAHVNAWRPKTLESAHGRWRTAELVLGKHTAAAHVTPEALDDMVTRLLATKTKHGRARSSIQVRSMVDLVTAMFRWAEVDRRLLAPSLIPNYRAKLSKEAKRQVVKMEEFRAEDRLKVLAKMDPTEQRQWRGWALTVLLAYCGPRQTAARSLEWSDLDMEAGLIRWRPETDKMGGDRVQPMPAPVLEAFKVAREWREKEGYAGPLVFFSVQKRGRDKGQPWTYQAYIAQLHDAERRAGLEPVKYKGAHAFRRGIAGDVHSATGSEKQAADWIGDRSVKIVRDHYLLERTDELRKTANLVSANATNRNADTPTDAKDDGEPAE